MQQTSFVKAFLPVGFGRNERLERITQLIDWAALERLIAPLRPSEVARPPYEPLSNFKALSWQQWYGRSNPRPEEALFERVSFSRFSGFALDT